MSRPASYPANWMVVMYDLFAANPAGVTIHDIAHELGTSEQVTRYLVRQFRLAYGATEDVNLVCEPDGWAMPWRYRLAGNLTNSSGWVRNRIDDTESRIETMASVMGSIVRATNGTTRDGRRARIIERAMRHAQENLAIYNGQ